MLNPRSKERLANVDAKLITLITNVASSCPVDFQIANMGGYRSASLQNELYTQGKSKCDGVTSKSKHQEGKAVDIVVYIDGKPTWDKEYYAYVAGAVLTLSNMQGVKVRWGGDWNSNGLFSDNKYNDLPHFELI